MSGWPPAWVEVVVTSKSSIGAFAWALAGPQATTTTAAAAIAARRARRRRKIDAFASAMRPPLAAVAGALLRVLLLALLVLLVLLLLALALGVLRVAAVAELAFADDRGVNRGAGARPMALVGRFAGGENLVDRKAAVDPGV